MCDPLNREKLIPTENYREGFLVELGGEKGEVEVGEREVFGGRLESASRLTKGSRVASPFESPSLDELIESAKKVIFLLLRV